MKSLKSDHSFNIKSNDNITDPEIKLSRNIKDSLVFAGSDFSKTPELPQRNAENKAVNSPKVNIKIYKKYLKEHCSLREYKEWELLEQG